jgi:hypothetical protein
MRWSTLHEFLAPLALLLCRNPTNPTASLGRDADTVPQERVGKQPDIVGQSSVNLTRKADRGKPRKCKPFPHNVENVGFPTVKKEASHG